MKLKTTLMLCSILSFCGLSADVLPFSADYNSSGLSPKSSISYSTGWRSDRHKSTERAFEQDGITGAGHNVEKQKHIDIWEVGFQATLAMPSGFECGCGSEWLNQFYLDGYAYWGTVGEGGKRRIDFYLADGTFDGSSDRNLRAGSTYDYQIALGWLYAISCEFGIAPKVGYSWDHQTSRPSSLIAFELPPTPRSSIAQYTKYTWKGPFLGFELVYDLCDFRFFGGYEYHWVKSDYSLVNNSFDVNVADCQAKSYKTHNNNRNGQVGYLGTVYEICDCWALKLQGKYRNFDGGTGRLVSHPQLSLEDCGVTKTKRDWRSWEVTFDLAYQF